MKVLLVGPDSVHVQRFYSEIKSREIEFQLLSETQVEWFDKMQFNLSFRSIFVPKLLTNYRRLRKILRREKPDIVHIHQINRLAVIVGRAAKKEGIKVIATAWGSDVLLVPKRGKFYARLTTSALQKADLITADAQVMIDQMQKLHPHGNYVIWQYGIDPISVETPKENFIYSNRMHEPLYRIDRVISYFAEFYNRHSHWKLLIGGSGSLTQKLKDQVQSLNLNDVIIFAGYCDAAENAKNYSRSKIYISIPSSDGTSVSLMEAMSAGCIPIVSNLEVNKVWVHDGENGIVEKPGANPFAEAITLHADEVKNHNQQITSQISRSKMTDQMVAFYHRLIGA